MIKDSNPEIKRRLSLLESHVGFKLDTILKQALKIRDSYTLEHSERVVLLAEQIGHQMGLNEQQMDILSLAAGFHDIGKIGIADQVLLKPGKLSGDEYNDIKQHPIIGANMLRSLGNPVLDEVALCVLHHHEQWDGKGYPDGLRGDEIPTISRIIAVVDAYDAMTTTRSYRSQVETKQALDIISRESGKQFCPKAVQAILELCSKQHLNNQTCT
ncbi:MAG: HD-GYP domain-containing protein [Candidatus Thiodiazotropha lotti]|uniref:HD-GYP domain-containing protein n=1 Tax=Candidatus Thiodiazotropha endoloripes TaxID=1818881 RepID=A0A1E2UKR2_9GAMM|nr:HD-GYP domain-containing protein [Candidatus Thiodiazotropha endoloripes]MCG7898867.1 HD-GYP domain-containing protein [Candidatus Thiodiazotropha weberae]MCG7992230.1 HD-GYP domain-containing protein [Candidatus Thiodiazotropha lotti]MCG7904212.1 HD-GYP domain-containing protein [Candidatus Thiodiazotropha weberae]MCG8001509.1 HD-GYP domain-containing protein [Candidatus Thiodiazotropha lotti]MCW4183888.1 HD-GYP domain-containing protein [Candidatus Thiodiazotropha weberae]